VQGVGFRPFILRLARELNLKGWVRNAGGVVEMHVEGPGVAIDRFIEGVGAQSPAFARPGPPLVGDAAKICRNKKKRRVKDRLQEL
jgi:acylphosphatase